MTSLSRGLAALLLSALPVVGWAQPAPDTQPTLALRNDTAAVFERLKAAAGSGATELGLSVYSESRHDVGRLDRRVFVSEGTLWTLSRGASWAAERGPELHGGRSAESLRRDLIGLVLAREVASSGVAGPADHVDARAVALFGRAGGDTSPASMRRLLRLMLEFPVQESGISAYTTRLMDRFDFWGAVGRGETRDPATIGSQDDFRSARRRDGTIDWAKARERVRAEAGGLLHFGLALFLKELVLVAETGDESRIEELFDGLTRTDFYVHYGLFALGARAGDVAFASYLQRFVKPGFVQGMLRRNVVLASGMLLPDLVSGRGSPRAFAISLTALGLSSAAVEVGMAPLRWAMTIDVAERSGALASFGLAPRLVRMGGWFYTVAETAVVLYAADKLEGAIEGGLAEHDARSRLSQAGVDFLHDLAREAATPDDARKALGRLHGAFGDWREHLVAPARAAEIDFARKLERLAREAKLSHDAGVAGAAVAGYPGLMARLEREGRTLESWLEERSARSSAEVARKLERAVDVLRSDQARAIAAVYASTTRRAPNDRAYLEGAPDLAAVLPGQPGGPLSELRRRFDELRLRHALSRASKNRLESYDDELRLLRAATRALRARGRADLAAELEGREADLTRLARAEEALYLGAGMGDGRIGFDDVLGRGVGR